MAFSEYIIYADESGDHSLGSINRDYPVFVLDFCILRKDHYANKIVPEFQTFKFEHFGHDLMILHEHEIRRQIPPFAFLTNETRREVFMGGLNRLIGEANFTIVAAAIHKEQLIRNREQPGNPYELALAFCMEGARAFLHDHGQHEATTHLIVERRGDREDEELNLAFHRIREGMKQNGLTTNIEIINADKKSNSTGLQLADLTARPIGRHVLDPVQPNRAWDILEAKLYRGSSDDTGMRGLRIFP